MGLLRDIFEARRLCFVADRWLSRIPIELEYRDTQISLGGVVKGLSPVERSRKSNLQCSVLPYL